MLGTALSTLSHAPVQDSTWEKWCVGPGMFSLIHKTPEACQRWFEIHIPNSHPATAEYWKQLPNYQGEVWTFEPQVIAPFRKEYPRQAILDEFGEWPFRGTVAWMLALAIYEMRFDGGELTRKVNGDAIGLWGIESALDAEWSFERPGILHFLDLAMRYGIEVKIPADGDLLHHKPPYPGTIHNQLAVKQLNTRRKMLEEAKTEAEVLAQKNREYVARFEGALDELKRQENYLL